ncbi:MAG: glycosyltransferase family 4 protein [Coriobacteriia bacterium]|nr:glycosyltransferase family 4 protein [Coriobacteriia bacterium]
MRILHVAAANSLQGGGEKHVADLMTELAKRGDDVALVAPDGGDLERVAEDLGVKYYPASIASGYSSARVKAVRRAIEDFKPDIVHAHGHRAAMFARLADRQASLRVVYTLHGIHVGRGMLAPVKTAIERRLCSHTAYFIVTCRADEELGRKLRILDQSRCRVVYNGIKDAVYRDEKGSFRKEFGLSIDDVLVLHVGRLNPQKDQKTLIDAVASIKQPVGYDFKLVMICPGEDEARREMQSYVESKSYAGKIEILPGRPNLARAYADSDIFTLSSVGEGTPYSVLEAMQGGCAVVSTAVGGVVEAVEEDSSGLLVPPKNPSALGERLNELEQDKTKCREFGLRGAHIVEERYTLSAMVDQLVEVYERVIAGE